jgi:DNA-binding winged helix-turn-helix (wHTH) protein
VWRFSRRRGAGVIYRFDDFSLDADTRQLLSNAVEVHLSPKAFDLLLALAQNRTRAVSKADLQQRLWPSTFVDETNLPTLIAEIRRALHDSAHNPQFVRTVHRFGYRFVARVIEEENTSLAVRSTVQLHLTAGERRFVLAQGHCVLGRGRDATIRLDSAGVSRHHARIVVSGDDAHVEDLGSKNGTFLRGERVTGSSPLKDGDEIRLGPVALTFRAAPLTGPTETVA